MSILKFISDERGATAIEYALIGSLISIAIIGGVTALGTGMNNQYEVLRNQIRPKL